MSVANAGNFRNVARPDLVPSVITKTVDSANGTTQTVLERLYGITFFRKVCLIAVIIGIWQLYALYLDNQLIFPTFSDAFSAFWLNLTNGVLIEKVIVSLKTLLLGYGLGVVLAFALTSVAISTRIGSDLLELATAMFNPLPAIALLPLAMIWFGLGEASLVFVIVQSVIWTTALNTYSGFKSVSPTLRMVGKNYSLANIRYISFILVPAAFPDILAGLKIAWAFSWRTLVASELVFGVSSGSGGLGWFIYESKNSLDIPTVFAGLLTIIMIGLLVDNLVFGVIERRTIRRWGTHSNER